MIKVFLVDDHEVVRRGIRDLLDATDDMLVLGEASTGAEAIEQIPASGADIVVLDVRLGDLDGLTVWKALHVMCPTLRCMLLTAYADDDVMLAAIRAGAHGYVLKEVRGNELVESVRVVGSGRTLFTADVETRLRKRLDRPYHEDPRTACLSRQEHRILALLVEGLTNRQMAATMGLTEKTVKNYVSNLLLKLGMQCRTEAAVYAARADHDVMVASGNGGYDDGPGSHDWHMQTIA
jgi:DNA-binding NarL/FixJ family response regulator